MQTEAMVMDRHGGPEVLERRTISLPELGPHEVRVRVRAVALNHLDLWVRRGGPAFKLEFPHRLGSDMAGEIETLGSEVRDRQLGSRVLLHPALSCGRCAACLSGRDNLCRQYRILGESTQGGYARHVQVAEGNALDIGQSLELTEAAALPLCTLTAWQMVFRKACVEPAQVVLVNAGGSGVSAMIIQLCKLAGARVIASTSQPSKVERARELGADEVIVTSSQDLVAEGRRLTDRAGFDVVFDHVGGDLFEKSLALVRWGGRIVICGATSGFSPHIDLRQIFFRQIEILGSTMGRRADLLQALPLLRSRRIHAVVDRVMPLWQAREAHELLESRQAFGKVVLAVD